MTHTIALSSELEASLQEEAARHQQTPEEYLRAVVENLLRPTGRRGRSWSEIEGTATLPQVGEDTAAQRPSWSEAEGMFMHPMTGEDAQEWVTRTRREGDDHRERQLHREMPQGTS